MVAVSWSVCLLQITALDRIPRRELLDQARQAGKHNLKADVTFRMVY